MLGFWDIKTRARRDVHNQFAVRALYQDPATPATQLGVRWHDRYGMPVGNLPGGDYSEIFENVERLLFDDDELAIKGIVLSRNGTVTFPDFDNFRLTLDARIPRDGPVKIEWTIQRPRQP